MIVDNDRPLRVYFQATFAPRVLLGKSPRTKFLYLNAIGNFQKYLGREPMLSDLNDDSVICLMSWMLERGRSPHTVNKVRSQLLSIANRAAKKRVIPDFLDIPPLDCPDVNPEAYTVAQLKTLFEACGFMPGKVGTVPAHLYWDAINRVFLDTGERTEAVLSLRREWYDPVTGWLRVPASVRKGKRKPMTYKLRERTRESLDKINWDDRELIFYFPLSICTFYHHYDRLLIIGGLPRGRKSKPQKMRRSHATHIEAAGGNATESLGHESRRTTRRSYLDKTIIDKPPESDKLPEV